MAQPALADFLEDFGDRRAHAPDVVPFAIPEVAEHVFPPLAFPEPEPSFGPSEEEIEERIREAVARAEAELAGRLTEQYEAILTSERERHAEEIEALGREAGTSIASRIATEFASVQETVTGLVTIVVSRILGPLLGDDVTSRSIEALAEALKAALSDAEGVRVRVTGSQALYEALCEAVGERADQFDFTEGASMDLSVRIDDSLFETRISEWSAAMEKAIG